ETVGQIVNKFKSCSCVTVAKSPARYKLRFRIYRNPQPTLRVTFAEGCMGVHSRRPRSGGIMRTYPFALAVVLALAIAFPSHAAEKPHPTQGNQNQSKKVWTNDDMDQLRARGLISIVGPEVNEAATPAATAPSEPAFPFYNSRLEDPEWYAEKAADLQAELDKRQAALREQQTALAQAADRITQPGVA